MHTQDGGPARVVRHIAGCCEGGPCPNWYELDDKDFMFQGQEVTDPTTLAGIEVSPGETFVRVPRQVVLQGIQRLVG
jgi:hypothetical protein